MGCRGLWGAVPGQTLFQVMCDPHRPLQWKTQSSEQVQSFVLKQAGECGQCGVKSANERVLPLPAPQS